MKTSTTTTHCGSIRCWRCSWARRIPPAKTARGRDQGEALAGKSTLNRLELTPPGADESSRYKKIVASCESFEKAFVDVFLAAHPTAPKRIVLDLDATDDPTHGNQLGRYFH